MKAERRHELKTNTLAQGLEGLPAFWRQYGTKVLLAVVAVLAIILFIRFQRTSAQQQQQLAGESYANALSAIDNLRDPRLPAETRRQVQDNADAALRQVLEDSDDEVLRANALLAQGDLFWHLTHTPELPGAATQPAQSRQAAPQSRDELLDRAKRAYEAVTQSPGARPATLNSALMSLAAIAEEQGKWDEAAAQYDKIINNPALPESFKGEARLRKGDLDKLAKPALIGKAPTRTPETPGLGPLGPAAPTTSTAATGPTTQTDASTTPSTQPAGESAVER